MKNKETKSAIDEFKSLVYVILIALSIRIFLVEPFFVPTGSMKATILEGDYIFSTKYSYGYSKYSFPFSPDIFDGRILPSKPQRGDIVIFRPPMNMDIRYIKRLIGLPGDKIQLIDDVIYINDKPIKREEVARFVGEDGRRYVKYRETLPNGASYFAYKFEKEEESLLGREFIKTTEVFFVPQDKFFFLGDNRDDSKDSRFELGFVPFENFIAKGQFILFSTKNFLWLESGSIVDQITGVWSRVWPWLSSIRFNRIFTSIYKD